MGNLLDLLQLPKQDIPGEQDYTDWLNELGEILGEVDPDGVERQHFLDGLSPMDAAVAIQTQN